MKGYTITHTQDGKTAQFGGYSGYSEALSDDMNGNMAYAFSLWGPGGTEWLDGGRCQAASSCDSSTWEITNLSFTTGAARLNSSQSNSLAGNDLVYDDQWYANVLSKLYDAGVTFSDIEEVVNRGPERMTHNKINKVSKHCEANGANSEDCLAMVTWLKFYQF